MQFSKYLAAIFFLISLSPTYSHAGDFVVDGTVLELDESSFDHAISAIDYVLVDFYAPWCGHCKRLSPQLDEAAQRLALLDRPIVIAKLNADKYRSFADKYDIDGFPTLKVFIHGVPVDYSGPRKAESIVQHLKKFVAPDVSVLESDSAIDNFVEVAGTDFPIFIGFGLDQTLMEEFANKYKKKAWFSVAKDFSEEVMVIYDFDKIPALVSLYPEYNERNVFYGPFEDELLEEFIKQNLLPLTMPISVDTLKLLMDDERKVVVTILEDETAEKSLELIKILRSAASANRDLVFTYVGAERFEDFTGPFGIDKTKLPNILIWAKEEEYFQVAGLEHLDGDDLASQLSCFLQDYREGKAITKKFKGPSFMGYITSLISIKTIYILVFVAVIMMLVQHITQQESGVPMTTERSTEKGGSTIQMRTEEEDTNLLIKKVE